MKNQFVILSIDGGGLRGIVPVKILQHIEHLTGKKIIDCFDLFAGTSTGGLITCGLTLSGPGSAETMYSLEDIENVYINDGKRIFPYRKKLSKFYNYWVKGLGKPEFSDKGIHSVLSELFCNLDHLNNGDSRIMHCLKPILITSYDVKSNKPIFFKSRHAAINPHENVKLYDVCRATSAGPTYLPAHSFNFNKNEVTAVDGGVFMNNPSLGVLVEILKYKANPYYNRENLKPTDIYLLSIGTGHSTKAPIESEKAIKHGGKKNWITAITDVMMYGTNQATDYQSKELQTFRILNSVQQVNYLRINIDIADEHAEMTNSSDETRNYLINEVNNQFLNNTTVQNQLNQFIVNAGI